MYLAEDFADEGKKLGVRPTTDKLSRFNLVVPLFKAGKIRFPVEMKDTRVLGLFMRMEQVSLATKDGIKGNDDCLDTISMLQNLNAWKPNPEEIKERSMLKFEPDPLWGIEAEYDNETDLDDYIV